jgi:phosphoserine phosphatase
MSSRVFIKTHNYCSLFIPPRCEAVMKNHIRVVSLDLDGVLFDGPSAAYPLAYHLGLGERFMSVYKRMSEEKRDLEDSIREGSKIWKGIAADGTYDELVFSLPLMKGAEESVATLKELGFEVGCISSGVSQFFMRPFRERLNLDFAFSNILGEKDGAHDGTVKFVMGGKEKAETALQYLREKGYESESLAAIGDGANDIDIFRVAGFSIALNPESDAVSEAATVNLVTKDLMDILQFFR